MLTEIHSRIRSVDAAIKAVSGQKIDEYLLSMIFQHLCIRISGNIETSLFDILHAYSKKNSNPVVLRAIDRRLSSFQNPKCQKIVDLLSEFNPGWGSEFQKFAEEEDIKDKIDSISANRNQIAHGKPVGISAYRITEFYEAHRRALERICQIVI